MNRKRLSVLTGIVAVAIAPPLIGCGDDDEGGSTGSEPSASESAATLEVSVTEDGQKAILDAPESSEAGLTEITLNNEGRKPHAGQLIRVTGEHDEAEVLEGLESAIRGQEFPEWLFAGGGTGTVPPGESATVVQELEADSTYWVVDDEARGIPPVAPIEITGSSEGGDLPETGNKITAVDFGFETEMLTAGEPITFENAGQQPHHMIAAPFVDENATIEDAETFFKEEGEGEGKPPVSFREGVSTSVLEGGTAQVSSAELEPGRYALVCFIGNREGGPPHVQLGMVNEVEVE